MQSKNIEEINNIKTRTDVAFPLSALDNKKTKHKTLLYNLHKIINNTDISNIDYTNGGEQQMKPFKPLNNMFCDNIIVFALIPDWLFDNVKKIKKIKNGEEEEEKTINNKEVLKIAKTHLPNIINDIKQTFIMLRIGINKTDIKPTYAIESSGHINKPSKYL